MIVNSNPVPKRLRTETSSKEDKESSSHGLAGYSATGGSQVNIPEDGVGTFANIFTDDILPAIFANIKILKVRDLITFRLVNRCWRDAATSVLLKHNLFNITLHFNKVVFNKNGDAFGWVEPGETSPPRNIKIPPPNYKYFGYYQGQSFLSDLNELISTSPKFPCNSFRFNDWALYGFGVLCPPTEFNNTNQNQQDLFRFFDLYGKKIKKLCVDGQMSREAMNNLLTVYMPHLSCLDLGGYSLTEQDYGDDDEDYDDFPVLCPRPSSLEIKEIIWGCHEDSVDEDCSFEKELISVCPNLSSITEVNISALKVLIEIGKSHLIHHLLLYPSNNDHMLSILQFSKILTDAHTLKAKNLVSSFQLTKFSAIFRDCKEEYAVVVKACSIILSVCRDTLEYLEFSPTPSETLVNLLIPPLPRLESLVIFDNYRKRRSYNTKIHFHGDVIGEGVEAREIAADQTVDDVNALALQNHSGNCNIPAQYFPRLRKVKMRMLKTTFDPHKLMGFFSIESLGPIIGPSRSLTFTPSDTLVSVTILKWDTSSGRTLYDNTNMSKLFPNVVHLKIYCRNSSRVPNWVWTFSKLERCGISGLPQNQPNTKFVDSFFTGLPPKLCAAFKSDDVLPELVASSVQVFERTRSYIGNCENLKELKIKFFEKLNSKFASKLTVVYGFQDVNPRTKILFCFCAGKFSKEEIQESSQYLDSVAAYVQIQKF